HRGRQGAVRPAPGAGRARGVGGRHVRRPLRVLRPHELRGPAAHPGGAAQQARGAPGDHPGLTGGPAGRLHGRAAPARHRVGGARGRLALGPDRVRTDQGPHRPSCKPHREQGVTMGSVRVAVVGVGNCASSLVQGVEYYRDADASSTVPGLMHVQFGPYHVRDIEFVAAFDVDAKKVGFDLAEAILASENNTIKIADVPPTGVIVQRGPTLDGVGRYYQETIELAPEEPVDVVQVLKDTKADVLVSYLPVGSEEADRYYAQCAL